MLKRFVTACVPAIAALVAAAPAAADDPVLRFINAPDLLNADVEYQAPRAFDLDENDPDYATRRQVILDARAAASPVITTNHADDTNNDGVLSIQEGYRGGLQVMYEAIAAENGAFLTVSGDIVDGSWGLNSGTLAQKQQGIRDAGDLYWGAYQQHLADVGIPKLYGVIGDHEIGDNAWGGKIDLVPTYYEKYDEYLGMPSTTPRGGYIDAPTRYQADGRVWAKQEGNVLLVGVETFDMEYNAQGEITNIYETSPGQSNKRILMEQDQLDWLSDTLLPAANADNSIDHIVVMGHLPVDDASVRTAKSSNMRLAGGTESDFWQVLADGDVDLYLAGEVHAQSGHLKDGVTQIVGGGNFFATSDTEYTVVDVYEDRIELTLKSIDPVYNGERDEKNGIQSDPIGEDKSKTREWRVASGETFEIVGTMTIDTSGLQPVVTSATGKIHEHFINYDKPDSQQMRFDYGAKQLHENFVKGLTNFDGSKIDVALSTDATSGFKTRNMNNNMSHTVDGEQLRWLLQDSVEVKTSDGATSIEIVISGLEAGTYEFKSYHHADNARAGSGNEAVVHYDPDGDGSFVFGGQDAYSSGENAADLGIVVFTFDANGDDDVAFRLSNLNAGALIYMNGFEIEQLAAIPEPASLGLLAAGGLGLLWRRPQHQATHP